MSSLSKLHKDISEANLLINSLRARQEEYLADRVQTLVNDLSWAMLEMEQARLGL